MIITKLIGGLGNQMFQYALGRHLASKNNSNLKLDISEFNEYKLRKYELSCFNIQDDIATSKDLLRVLFPSDTLTQKTKKYVNQYLHRGKIIRYNHEKTFNFQYEILNSGENVYLDGYWQSEKYFKDIEQIIRAEFTFKSPPDPLNNKLMHQIVNSESVSIHIRRGDYVSDPKTNSILGICSQDYYKLAIHEMIQKIDEPTFFIFSDDHDWVKANMKIKSALYFFSNNDASKNFEDLRLMSLCKHHIIANSSFSWWGAWLSQDPQKTVIAPKRWFIDESFNTEDLVPKTWIRL